MAETTQPLAANFEHVQAHYDLSDEFFALFLDPSMTYSCGYFPTPQTTLAEAQLAKIDLSLGKCELEPGMKLLDVGSGWGATALRAREKYGVNVTGLTLSKNQFAHCNRLAQEHPGIDFRLEGWETYDGKADRIVSIGAFEHFGAKKYKAFFERCRAILPNDGVMLLHTITMGKPNEDWEYLRFSFFIRREIFPGGFVPPPEQVIEPARKSGFELVHVESLRLHYARTLDHWARNLEARHEDAARIAGEETYQTYMQYLTGCANTFRSGETNIHQFKFRVA